MLRCTPRHRLLTVLLAGWLLLPGQRLLAEDATNVTAPPGLRVRVFAKAPQIGSPVAISVADDGRVFVTSTTRRKKGNLDIRQNKRWVNNELSFERVADKEAFYRKTLDAKTLDRMNTLRDAVHLLRDTDGDGVADAARVYDDEYRGIVTGVAAGVLAVGKQDVYVTVCPNLWRLRDTDGDGKIDERKAIVSGFGVHVAYGGHNMHGLTQGPDGRIYWSIGDIASDYHPHEGAVFRCEPDGSNFEVYARGLRNPQELAFDNFGYLHTGDNDSDKGDKERWIHVVQHADYGWRIWWQFQDKGWGAQVRDWWLWGDEKLWHKRFPEQAAYILPPVEYLGGGPCGLVHHPGTGLGEEHHGRFFLAHFGGGAGNIRSYRFKRKGASFDMNGNEEIVKGSAFTGVDIGPDGALYLADWIGGWNAGGQGRVLRIDNPKDAGNPLVQQTAKLLREGMTARPVNTLAGLLAHANQRVRTQAHLELARRGVTGSRVEKMQAIVALSESLDRLNPLLQRVHALWAMGIVARRDAVSRDRAMGFVVHALRDADAELRGQAWRIIADHRQRHAVDPSLLKDAWSKALADSDAMVRYHAAVALHLSDQHALDKAVAFVAANGEQDVYLRHAGIVAMARVAKPSELAALASHTSRQVRLAAVVALRRLKSPAVQSFLADSDPLVVIETARAIHDVPISEASPALASLLNEPTQTVLRNPWLARRVLNANLRLGKAKHVEAVATYAANGDADDAMRLEAVHILADWAKPNPRDRVLTAWRPINPAGRAGDAVRPAVASRLTKLFDGSAAMQTAVGELAAKAGVEVDPQRFLGWLGDRHRASASRIGAMRLLIAVKAKQATDAINLALRDEDGALRVAAIDALRQRDVNRARAELQRVLESGGVSAKQHALALAGQWKDKQARALLGQWVVALEQGKAPPPLQVDIIDAAEASGDKKLRRRVAEHLKAMDKDKVVGRYRVALEGGDAEAGRDVFFNHVQAQCIRCHKVGDLPGTTGGAGGGDVAPNLAGIGKKKPHQYLLESIIDPNRAFAQGYEVATLVLNDGKSVVGKVVAEDDKSITLEVAAAEADPFDEFDPDTPEGKAAPPATERRVIAKGDVRKRTSLSPMPADMAKFLTLRELRDLVAYLAQQ